MKSPSYGDEGPIAALATSLAESALAIIRSSGPDAVKRVASIFSRPKTLAGAAGNSIVHGWILDSSGTKIDEVLISVFRSPRSYTGKTR
ncbi:hypothetical protein MASR2M78_09590 [Treponema sp.]